MKPLDQQNSSEVTRHIPEFSGEELKLIQAIKLGDFEKNPELRARLTAWVDSQMAETAKDPSPRANWAFDLKKCWLYAKAGLRDFAEENASDLIHSIRNSEKQIGAEAVKEWEGRLADFWDFFDGKLDV